MLSHPWLSELQQAFLEVSSSKYISKQHYNGAMSGEVSPVACDEM
jgi:hypothetical protein